MGLRVKPAMTTVQTRRHCGLDPQSPVITNCTVRSIAAAQGVIYFFELSLRSEPKKFTLCSNVCYHSSSFLAFIPRAVYFCELDMRRSNPESRVFPDCFVAALFAMTMSRKTVFCKKTHNFHPFDV
jgi:hypothetical protein